MSDPRQDAETIWLKLKEQIATVCDERDSLRALFDDLTSQLRWAKAERDAYLKALTELRRDNIERRDAPEPKMGIKFNDSKCERPTCVEAMKRLEGELVGVFAMIESAICLEREACAREADMAAHEVDGRLDLRADRIAKAIRARDAMTGHARRP